MTTCQLTIIRSPWATGPLASGRTGQCASDPLMFTPRPGIPVLEIPLFRHRVVAAASCESHCGRGCLVAPMLRHPAWVTVEATVRPRLCADGMLLLLLLLLQHSLAAIHRSIASLTTGKATWVPSTLHSRLYLGSIVLSLYLRLFIRGLAIAYLEVIA